MSTPKCSLLIVDDEALSAPDPLGPAGTGFRGVHRRLRAHGPADLRHPPDRSGPDRPADAAPRAPNYLEWVRHHSPADRAPSHDRVRRLEDAIDAINRGHVYHFDEAVADRGTVPGPPQRRRPLPAEPAANNSSKSCATQPRVGARVRDRTREIEDANHLLQQRTQEVEDANHLLQQRTRELEMLALTDPLTGLLNRRAIDDVARSELKRHARYPSPLALAMIDADHFREINRVHLYPGGDAALITLARTLTGSLRTVDSVGRIGGEEFLVVCPETSLDGAVILAERIRSTVERSRASLQRRRRFRSR